MIPNPQQGWWQNFLASEAQNRAAVLQRMAQLNPANTPPWAQFQNPLMQRTPVPLLGQGAQGLTGISPALQLFMGGR